MGDSQNYVFELEWYNIYAINLFSLFPLNQFCKATKIDE